MKEKDRLKSELKKLGCNPTDREFSELVDIAQTLSEKRRLSGDDWQQVIEQAMQNPEECRSTGEDMSDLNELLDAMRRDRRSGDRK